MAKQQQNADWEFTDQSFKESITLELIQLIVT